MSKRPEVCAVCGKKLGKDNSFMIAFEVPYCNLYVHRNSCRNIILDMIDSLDVDNINSLCNGSRILLEEE